MKPFFFCLLISVFSFACQSPSRQNSDHDAEEVADTNQTSTEEPAPVSEEIGTVFIGKIDQKYPITVNLIRNEDELSGSYYYDKIGKTISLKGKVIEEKSILEEFDEKGAVTGRWELEGGNLSGWLYGKWINPKNGKDMRLDLTEADSRIWKNQLSSPWNGVWTDGIGTLEFKILAPDTFYFNHFSMNARYHIGELTGELTIKNNRGLYQDDIYETGGEDICKISYQKMGDTIKVKQETSNDCGAGQGVYFDGNYVKEEQYKAYWETKPLGEKIGDDRVWQLMGDRSHQYLHLKGDGNFTWTIEANDTSSEQTGTWETKGKSTLVLVFDPSANVREWKVEDVYTFSMTISREGETLDFQLLGYQ
ncbi:MAG: hypothetical protein R3B93_06830 [Bacteroidia bacterium]